MIDNWLAGGSRPASSGGGFFDNAVGAQFANRSSTPSREAPRQSAPSSRPSSSRPSSSRPASSGGGFFDNAVGAQFANKSASSNRGQASSAPSRPPTGKGPYLQGTFGTVPCLLLLYHGVVPSNSSVLQQQC